MPRTLTSFERWRERNHHCGVTYDEIERSLWRKKQEVNTLRARLAEVERALRLACRHYVPVGWQTEVDEWIAKATAPDGE